MNYLRFKEKPFIYLNNPYKIFFYFVIYSGSLIIKDQKNSTIWTSNTIGKGNAPYYLAVQDDRYSSFDFFISYIFYIINKYLIYQKCCIL